MQEGLLGQSARQRGEEEGGQDHRKEGRSMQEAATGELQKVQMVLPVLSSKLFLQAPKEAHLVSTKDNEPQVK